MSTLLWTNDAVVFAEGTSTLAYLRDEVREINTPHVFAGNQVAITGRRHEEPVNDI